MSNTNFLTIETLKGFTSISSSVDESLLEPFIGIGEEMNIHPILGVALTSELINQIDENNLSTNNEILVNDFILQASAWCTFLEASTFLTYKTEAKGIVKKSSDNSQPIDRQEFNAFRQSIQDKAVFYKNRLIRHLEENRELYPLYRPNGSIKSLSNSTGIFLGI